MREAAAVWGTAVHVQEMATVMREHGMGSLVIVDDDNRPLGIVTERDLVYKVVAAGRPDATAGEIMSAPPVSVTPDTPLYLAVDLMLRRRCRRLVVVGEDGRLTGLLSMRDLFQLQTNEPGTLLERIEGAESVAELGRAREDMDRLVQRLYLADVAGPAIAGLVTDCNDAITRRVLQLNEARLAGKGRRRPEGTYAWVCFGSQGRREQVLRGDQDNGLIVGTPRMDQETEVYFRELAGRSNEDLATCGFPLCDGGVMAREDKYFGSLEGWRERVHLLVHNAQDGETLRDLTVFLDMRHVAGDRTLVEELVDLSLRELSGYPYAVRALAEDATSKPVPVNFLGRLQYERDGRGRRGLNIKKYAMLPLLAGVKALAVNNGVRATATIERLARLQELGVLERESTGALTMAQELFLRLKLQTSLEEVFSGDDREPGGAGEAAGGHFVYPQEWSAWERQNLKNALKSIERLHSLLRFHFML